jgi:geranylgeranyl reductase family protein
MSAKFDVLVIGAGPSGSTVASLLAAAGLATGVLEEHAVIGEPVDCTGVVGAEACKRFAIPADVVVGSIDAVTVHAPGGPEATYRSSEPMAYIIDRAEFDRRIARQAEAAGARLMLGTRAVAIERNRDGIRVDCQEADGAPHSLSAAVVILACGPKTLFHERLGMGACSLYWKSAHALLPGDGLPNPQVYLGRAVAPDGFGWAVPVHGPTESSVRVGVNSRVDPQGCLQKLCAEKFPHLMSPDGVVQMRSWVIPLVPPAKTYAERVVAVGDAAGQVKSTSGGGIYFGMLSAELAAETITEAFRRGDFRRSGLAAYEERWRALLGLDLRLGTLFRRLFSRMTDRDMDDLLRTFQEDGVLSRLNQTVHFDWHRELIFFLLKHPTLSRILLRRWWDREAGPDLPPLSE